MDKISVVLCTYNGQKYIAEQLDSIINQSLPPDEIIIQDDNSTDSTWQILESYKQRYPQIKLFKNNPDLKGPTSNFFSAFTKCNPQNLIAVSDQDDIWHIDKLKKQLSFIGTNLLCASNNTQFSNDGFPVDSPKTNPIFNPINCFFYGRMAGHTLLFRQELLQMAKFSTSYKLTYDFQLSLVALLANKFCYIDEPLVLHRLHFEAATATAPTRNRIYLCNDLHNFSIIFRNRQILHAEQTRRTESTNKLIASSQFYNPDKTIALEMGKLILQNGIIPKFKLWLFFIKNRNSLRLYSDSKYIFLKALVFPIYMLYYYRYALSPIYKNKFI